MPTPRRPRRSSPARKPAAAGAAAAAAAANGGGGGGEDWARGTPPAPLVVLALAETKRRVKKIIGAQSGEAPGMITDGSPVRRPNISLPRLRNALNKHFFDALPTGLAGFPPGETVGELAQRVKRTRDPQLS